MIFFVNKVKNQTNKNKFGIIIIFWENYIHQVGTDPEISISGVKVIYQLS